MTKLKQKRSFEEKLPLILAFVLPILIMLGIFAGKEIWPFGENCFLRTDLYHQYVAFFENYGERLRAGGSLTYAFDIGLGSNYLALLAYYLSGPLHIFAFLIPQGWMIEFITYLIVLKIGACGFTMAWYLSKRYDTRHFGIAFCGVCYALSGYLAAYSWNIMWLDVLWLAPIVLYGLEQLVEKDKPFLYCISLGLAILCNYYISIMLCIFLVFYFLCRMVCLPRVGWKRILLKFFNFSFYSVLAGGLACVLVIPAAYALMGTASANTTFPRSVSNYFSILEMIARHLTVVEVETGLDHWPNLYCGVAVFLFVPLYYMNRDVDYKEKVVNTALLAFLLLSFNTNVLNYIWHGFHYPNSLPCRQSYLYNFIILVMVFEGIRALPKITKGKLLGTIAGAVGLILVIETVADPEEIPYYACYASIAFICLYGLFCYLHKTRRVTGITAVCLSLCLLIVEMGLNTAVTSVSWVNRTNFMAYDDSYDELIEMAKKDNGDSGFFRIERYKLRTKNDGPYFGYDSASIFSSTTNAKISQFYKKLGMEGNTNAYAFTGATPFTGALLDVKYIISESELPETALLSYVGKATNKAGTTSRLYRAEYTLPLGFLLPDDTDTLWSYAAGSPMKVQNSFVNVAAGVGNILETVESHVSGSTMTANVASEGYYYVYVTGSVTKVNATVNGKGTVTWDNLGRGYLVRTGYLNPGDEIKVSAYDSSATTITASCYRFDEERFIEACNQLTSRQFTVTSFVNDRRNTEIRGTADAPVDSLLSFSIPFEKGWSITVDGKEAEVCELGNALLSVHIPAGRHEVVLHYEAEGHKLGQLVSLASLLLLLFLMLMSYVIRALRQKKAETDAQETPQAAGTAKDRITRLHEMDEAERRRDEIVIPDFLNAEYAEAAASADPRKTADKEAEEALLRLDYEAEKAVPAVPAPEPEILPASEPEVLPAPEPEEDALPEGPAAPAPDASALPAADEGGAPSPAAAPAPAETDTDRMFRRIDFFDRRDS